MAKESWGKKHICPFCNSLFYDMKQPLSACPKCKKNLTEDDELEFIKKKTLVKMPPKDEEVDLKIDEEEARLSEEEMFLEDVAKKPLKNYDDGDEEEYDY